MTCTTEELTTVEILQENITPEVASPVETTPPILEESDTTAKNSVKNLVLKPDDKTIELDEIKPKSNCFYITISLVHLFSFILLLYISIKYVKNSGYFLLTTVVIDIIVLMTFQYIAGVLKVYGNVKTSYTRKIVHLTFFSLPFILNAIFGKSHKKYTGLTILWNLWIFELSIGILITIPYRNFFNRLLGDIYDKNNKEYKILLNFPSLLFTAMERKEDRPNSLKWIQIQVILIYLFITILSGVNFYTIKMDNSVLLLIPTLISGFGDGLAEPVGRKFGKNHQYTVNACCSDYKYIRSYQGSFAVWIVGVIAVCISYKVFNTVQFIVAIIVLPIVGTIAEAKSPHSLDNPFIVLFVGICMFPIMEIPKN